MLALNHSFVELFLDVQDVRRRITRKACGGGGGETGWPPESQLALQQLGAGVMSESPLFPSSPGLCGELHSEVHLVLAGVSFERLQLSPGS